MGEDLGEGLEGEVSDDCVVDGGGGGEEVARVERGSRDGFELEFCMGGPGREGGISVRQMGGCEWRERLPDELAERRAGAAVTATVVRLANAVAVLSLAKAARERRLCLLLTEEDWR